MEALVVASVGAGGRSLRSALAGRDGIRMQGFVQLVDDQGPGGIGLDLLGDELALGVAPERCVGDEGVGRELVRLDELCLLYTSPSPRDKRQSRMPSSA